MRNYRFLHRSFINTESCVKASVPSLDDTSLKPTTPPWWRPTDQQKQDVFEDRAIVTERESTRQSHQKAKLTKKKKKTYAKT